MNISEKELTVAKIRGRVIRLNEIGDSRQVASVINASAKKKKKSVVMKKVSQVMEPIDDMIENPYGRRSSIPIKAKHIKPARITLTTALMLSAPKTIP